MQILGESRSVARDFEKVKVMPLGVVVRRVPGVTRWAKWSWKAIAVLPGAGPASWQVLREEGDAREYHAATVPLELHRAEAEAYKQGLTASPPSVYVVLREDATQDPPLEVTLVTASPYEAQDYADSGEELVEKVAMPNGLIAWVQQFTDMHFKQEEFKKRRRDKRTLGEAEDGIGDARIKQVADVYRAPGQIRKERVQ